MLETSLNHMTGLMKSMKSTIASTLAAGALLSLSAQAAIIYQDDFNFSGSLNGRTPNQTTGSNWTAFGTWTGNGASITPGEANRSAYLPFVPQSGMIYELTAGMSNASGSATTWISLGFSESGTPPSNNNFTSGGIATVILRDNSLNQTYAGSGVANSSGSLNFPTFVANTFYEYKVVLNTTGANWTYDVYRDGVQLDVNGGAAGLTYTWSSGNPTIGSVLLSNNTASSSARYDYFRLEAIPEPSSVLSLAAAGLLGLLRRRR